MKSLEEALQAVAVENAEVRLVHALFTDGFLLLSNQILEIFEFGDHPVEVGKLVLKTWLCVLGVVVERLFFAENRLWEG